MTYPEAIRYLESFVNYEKKSQYHYKRLIKLERIKELLEILGNPQSALTCIHISGTKGKGSTCAFIAYILREAGYKVGLYTSPHLSDFRERIRILSCPSSVLRIPSLDFEGLISEEELADLVKRIKSAVDKYNKNSKYGPLTFFEAYTALALLHFKEKKVDFTVLETGLGGRLDATNVVEPLVCAITPISLEHTQLLGNTLAKIAGEKAGIIKKCRPSSVVRRPIVVSAPQEKEVRQVIINRCRQTGARLYEVGKDITYKVKNQKSKIKNEAQIKNLKIKGVLREYKNLKIKLLGEHQVANAATAVGAVEALKLQGIKINIDDIRKGLYNTLWPGRCEVITRKPLIILDGAQNVSSANALKKTIRENFSAEGGSASGRHYKRIILVLGISSDKDIKGICGELFPIADEIILTKADSPRAAGVAELRAKSKELRIKQIHSSNSVKDGLKIAGSLAKKDDLVLVTGSLFVVGEAREAINNGSFYSPH